MQTELKKDGEEAGITAYMSDRYHYEICVKRENDENYIFLRKVISDLYIEERKEKLETDQITLGIKADEDRYHFYYMTRQNEKHFIGTAECKFLATEVSSTFTGTYLGIYVTANGGEGTPKLYIDKFVYHVKEKQ